MFNNASFQHGVGKVGEEMITKSDAKKLQRDFIPNGGRSVDIRLHTFRRTDDYEIYQCCRQVAYDPQSGPIYCGKVSEYIARIDDTGIVTLCERHKPPQELIK